MTRAFAFAAALALAACTPAGRPGSAEAEQALRDANVRYDRAIVSGDRAALEQILAPDYQYVTAQGEVRGRAATIDQLTSGRVRIASQGSEDVRLRWLGDQALMTGRFRARVTMNGATFPIDERYSAIWSHQDGAWRLRHEHASNAPAPPQ